MKKGRVKRSAFYYACFSFLSEKAEPVPPSINGIIGSSYLTVAAFLSGDEIKC